uniref:WD_REPEATS_REGION domain-containing protein n=1 Tax=Caenorhabditis tropicalis TaxID=1561998 RepID=A0A1I7T0V2_9PELO
MLSALERRYEKLQFGSLFPHILDENRMMESLESFWSLDGHNGCVNTLRWNKSGTLLASGSDDHRVIIWKDGKEHFNLETGHEGNVFAVEFMPQTSDRKLVTGAADEVVILHDIETNTSKRWDMDGRVKRLCTVEHDPTLYWAAVEDTKGVYQFDTRLDNPEVVVQSTPERELKNTKSVAISEAKPHLIVVGFDETTVRLYDRRNFQEPILSFAPLAVKCNSYHATHVAFNKTGTEFVVNHGGGGGVYVFSVDASKDPKTMERFHAVLEQPKEAVISSSSLPYPELREVGSTAIREKHFAKAVDYYSELISHNYSDRAFRSVCHSNRATASLLRRRRGDTYSCIRDCVKALEIHRGNSKALFRLIKSFISLEHPNLAKKCIDKFKEWFPNDMSIAKMEEDLEQIEVRENRRELESIEGCADYQSRFVGSINHQTDIKEANFFGSRDQFIISGSDCGNMFVWNRDTSKLVGIWKADNHILNIVQPHPYQFSLATSGIDNEILLWQPYLDREDDFPSRRVADPFEHMEKKAEGSDGRFPLYMLHDLARDSPQCVQS